LLWLLLMEPTVRHFLRASLCWLVAGASLGVAMAVHPIWGGFRTAHMHMMLLGFVVMMIAGVAYHVLPRMASSPLYSTRLAKAHLVIANIGLAVFVTGFAGRAMSAEWAAVTIATGAMLSWTGLVMLAANLWLTLSRAGSLQIKKSSFTVPQPLTRKTAS
jgi:cbb3-type cytochrome oxidase subunit 1